MNTPTTLTGKSNVLQTTVDLDASPSLPFPSATIKSHTRQGKVTVQYFPDDDRLLVNGKEVLSGDPKSESALNATFADFLLADRNFIPKKFKPHTWIFGGTKFADAGTDLYVRGICPGGRTWYPVFERIGSVWPPDTVSASLES